MAAPRALFVSGYADLGPYHDDPMVRGVPVLFKPFTLSDLFSAVHQALASSSSPRGSSSVHVSGAPSRLGAADDRMVDAAGEEECQSIGIDSPYQRPNPKRLSLRRHKL